MYPVNVARNIARDAALTHFILASDIELYPSPNLIPRFLNMIARNAKPLNTSSKPRVFPISIFEVDAKVQVSHYFCNNVNYIFTKLQINRCCFISGAINKERAPKYVGK